MMKDGFGSRIAIPGGGMMSFVSNGPKNERVVVVKDEDLSLFRELHRQRHCNLLLQPLALSDEFDSPFPYLPNGNNDQILRISSGSGGSDLLVENDKHDYDWLKTPPATPLFPSIEMDAAANNNNNYYYYNNNSVNALTSSKEPPVGVGPLLQQPISRFGAGTGNNSEVSMSSSCRPSNININVNINSNGNIVQKTKPSTSKNDVQVQKRPSSTRTNSGTRPRLLRQHNNNNNGNIVLICKETPPNLRTEQRSSSTTRGQRAASTTAKPRQKSCSPTVDRGWKYLDDQNHHHQPIILKAATTKKEMNGSTTSKGTVVVGSRMVEKLINARKSASTTNNVGHQYRMKEINANPNPNVYSRPNQKSTAFRLPWNNNNVIITPLKPTFK